MHHWLGLIGLTSHTSHPSHSAPEHHVEHVHGGAEAPSSPAPAPLLDCLLPALVIDLPLLTVRQDLVRLKYRTE